MIMKSFLGSINCSGEARHIYNKSWIMITTRFDTVTPCHNKYITDLFLGDGLLNEDDAALEHGLGVGNEGLVQSNCYG